MRYSRIKVPIYEHWICFVHAEVGSEVEDKFGFDPTESGATLFATTYPGSIKLKGLEYGCIYIVLNDKCKYKKLSIGIIAHECLHAVNMIFEHIGLRADEENDEAQTYLLQWIVDKAMAFYKNEINM